MGKSKGKKIKKVCEQCGEEFEVSPSKANTARFCSWKCSGASHRLSLSDYHALAKKRGFKWIGPEVPRNNIKTWWECEKGHKFETTHQCIRQGTRCTICTGWGKKTIADYHALAEKRGIRWVGRDLPPHTDAASLWACSTKHQWQTSYGNIKQGSGCPVCFRESIRGENNQNWKGRVTKICPECDTCFDVRPSESYRIFCSKACHAKGQTKIAGEKHHLWKKRVEIPCEECGKTIKVPTYLLGEKRFCSKDCAVKNRSKAMRGKNHPSWKERETRFCIWCGNILKLVPCRVDKKFCSKECFQGWQSWNMCGERHPQWKGGMSPELYGPGWTETLKRKIRKRDNYTCAIDGEWGNHVHHMNYDKADHRPENLITLCCSCHAKTNTNREHWEMFLSPATDA